MDNFALIVAHHASLYLKIHMKGIFQTLRLVGFNNKQKSNLRFPMFSGVIEMEINLKLVKNFPKNPLLGQMGNFGLILGQSYTGLYISVSKNSTSHNSGSDLRILLV